VAGVAALDAIAAAAAGDAARRWEADRRR
jgi:hypothetical protein